MNEGWKCPVCGRGVAPDEKTCDHGATSLYRRVIVSEPTTPTVHFVCEACRNGGTCNCYIPERDSFTCESA